MGSWITEVLYLNFFYVLSTYSISSLFLLLVASASVITSFTCCEVNNLLVLIVTLPLQIWDFNLGRLRGTEESGQSEVVYAASDSGFMMKSYSELLKEASLATTKGCGDIFGVNPSMAHEDTVTFSVSLVIIHI